MHIIFLATGGTIDKDYPHSQAGWAFEFGDEPATARLLDRLLHNGDDGGGGGGGGDDDDNVASTTTAAVKNGFLTHQLVTVCQKDSLEMTNVDRQALWETIVEQSTRHYYCDKDDGSAKRAKKPLGFVVTHGTDTLLETARYLQDKVQQQQQQQQEQQQPLSPNFPFRIVVTGAMRPERFYNSDAPICWGMAVGAVQCIMPTTTTTSNGKNGGSSVYVAIQGLVKPAYQMQRDGATGRFY